MEYNQTKANIEQERYCDEHKFPHFAPRTGTCWCCGKNIYAEGGISVEEAGLRLITGCPFCHRSYVD